jgi:hypothetical protein
MSPQNTVELDLTPDRMPRTLWFAAGPPLINIAIYCWLAAHWREIPWAGYTDPDILWRHTAFRNCSLIFVFFGWFELWLIASAILQWYGSPRNDERLARFHLGLAQAWLAALLVPGLTLPINIAMSRTGIALCIMCEVSAVALFTIIFVAGRKRGLSSPSAPPGALYFDFRDPAMFGPRGMNLGNPWQWALIVAGFLLPGIIAFLI